MMADQPGDPAGAVRVAGDLLGVLGRVERLLDVAGGEMNLAQQIVNRRLHLERPQRPDVGRGPARPAGAERVTGILRLRQRAGVALRGDREAVARRDPQVERFPGGGRRRELVDQGGLRRRVVDDGGEQELVEALLPGRLGLRLGRQRAQRVFRVRSLDVARLAQLLGGVAERRDRLARGGEIAPQVGLDAPAHDKAQQNVVRNAVRNPVQRMGLAAAAIEDQQQFAVVPAGRTVEELCQIHRATGRSTAHSAASVPIPKFASSRGDL